MTVHIPTTRAVGSDPLRGLPFNFGTADVALIEPAGRLAQFMRVVDDFQRDEIEQVVDLLIARMDADDGDPEAEDGDEDACIAGEDRMLGNRMLGHIWDGTGDDDAERSEWPALTIVQDREAWS